MANETLLWMQQRQYVNNGMKILTKSTAYTAFSLAYTHFLSRFPCVSFSVILSHFQLFLLRFRPQILWNKAKLNMIIYLKGQKYTYTHMYIRVWQSVQTSKIHTNTRDGMLVDERESKEENVIAHKSSNCLFIINVYLLISHLSPFLNMDYLCACDVAAGSFLLCAEMEWQHTHTHTYPYERLQ